MYILASGDVIDLYYFDDILLSTLVSVLVKLQI